MAHDNSVLIVGIDGLVGRQLFTQLQISGSRVIGTSRRDTSFSEQVLPLDLTDNLHQWHLPDVGVAILCAGVTQMAACYQNPTGSYQVNVTGMVALAERLVKQGTFVLYLSTDKVFAGSQPNLLPDTPYSPLTIYGQQKAEAEAQILNLGEQCAVLRLSKVLGEQNLFTGWIKSLVQGETIHPFYDMTFAPVLLPGVISVIRLLIDNRQPGIWQFTGKKDITYSDAAFTLAEMLGIDTNLIEASSFKASSLLQEPPSDYTTLNMDRLHQTFGIQSLNIKQVLRYIIARNMV